MRRRPLTVTIARLSATLLAGSGCQGDQSALAPAGPAAVAFNGLWWTLLSGAGVLYVLVLGFAIYATRVAPGRHPGFSGNALILGGGVILPVVLLSGLLVYSFAIGRTMTAAAPDALRISVIGHQWWWEVRYQPADADVIVSANEIVIPVGRQVELALASADVIHSFWVPRLAGKIDMVPGRTNRLLLQADQPGIFRGQCAEYCGGPHALMALDVIAVPATEFPARLAALAAPAAAPAGPTERQGRRLFLDSGCGACHTVRGSGADGRLGPDLTHLGTRRSLAAGILPNNVGTMAGWIAGSQQIKPGNRMPSFNTFTGSELRALAAWLASLK